MKSFTILSIFIATYHVVVAVHVEVIEQQSADDTILEMTEIDGDTTQFSFMYGFDSPRLYAVLKSEDGETLGKLSTSLCMDENDDEQCVGRIMTNGITDGCSIKEGDFMRPNSYDVDDQACNTFLDINSGNTIIVELQVYTFDYEPVSTMKYQVSG